MTKMLETRGAENFPGTVDGWKIASLSETLGYCFDARLVKDDDRGGYVVSIAQLPGVISEGDSVLEAIQNIVEAFRATIETYLAEGMPIPWIEAPRREPGEEYLRIAVNA